MRQNPYRKYKSQEFILRDEIAIDRTILANEQTVLAYVRTAFAFAIAGFTVLELFDTISYSILGVSLILLGILNAAWGTYRFLILRRRLRHLGQTRFQLA